MVPAPQDVHEANFYKHLAPRLEHMAAKVPLCLFVESTLHESRESGAMALLLEDLRPAFPRSIDAALSIAQAKVHKMSLQGAKQGRTGTDLGSAVSHVIVPSAMHCRWYSAGWRRCTPPFGSSRWMSREAAASGNKDATGIMQRGRKSLNRLAVTGELLPYAAKGSQGLFGGSTNQSTSNQT